MHTDLSALPGWALLALAVVLVAEITLWVVALTVLFRTPQERLTLPRWVWVLIIVAVQIIGAVVFLLAGRRPAEVDETRRTPVGVESAVDTLYGPGPAGRPHGPAPDGSAGTPRHGVVDPPAGRAHGPASDGSSGLPHDGTPPR